MERLAALTWQRAIHVARKPSGSCKKASNKQHPNEYREGLSDDQPDDNPINAERRDVGVYEPLIDLH